MGYEPSMRLMTVFAQLLKELYLAFHPRLTRRSQRRYPWSKAGLFSLLVLISILPLKFNHLKKHLHAFKIVIDLFKIAWKGLSLLLAKSADLKDLHLHPPRVT